MSWTRIRSWHIVAGTTAQTDRPGWLRMFCGRLAPPGSLQVSAPPADEATCESCFRARERQS